jgi:tRNA G18 (ribose-2'-O)-methylase SpoU
MKAETCWMAWQDKWGFLPCYAGVELDDKAINIREFHHPERACYMLGAEDHGIPTEVLGRCHRTLKLDGDESMNVAVAGSVVVYHRSLARKAP